MLKVIRKSDRSVPVVCCDVCGSWIDDASFGAAVFPHIGPNEGDAQEVVLVHKGACHDLAESKSRALGQGASWQEMKRYLADALHNSGVSVDTLLEMQSNEEKFGRL